MYCIIPTFTHQKNGFDATCFFLIQLKQLFREIQKVKCHLESRVLLIKIPGTFDSIIPEEIDKINDMDRVDQIERAFKIISNKNRAVGKKTLITPNGMKFLNSTYMHNFKITEKVGELLNQYDLVYANSEDAKKFNFIPKELAGNYSIINKDAANIIVSYMADNIGYRTGLPTITDTNLNYLFNSLDDFQYKSNFEVDSLLAKSIIQCSIPQNIHKVSLSQYSDIRQNFIGVREVFPSLIEEITKENRLSQIHDKDK